ncbi:cobalt ECF transporter T component CbiQ [Paenibacillus abyssi]|uniref:Cobalt ECF transporter T component CbiQ n=1 Tax=Paenibacillus abyssi TaxID=1340531 RepID=A0A917LH26_9BACL|nr:cobalt ECF transporter T component CbiQ [Paenibacillus abyssi]GGG22505.1 cobalt ECF transporter T component CbiQ [Paenibacillus abyssi]
MMKQIDSVTYSNRFRLLSPMWKCGFASVLFLFAYLTGPVLQAMIVVWMLIWTVIYAKVPTGLYARLMLVSCSLYVLSLPALMLEFRSAAAGGQIAQGLLLVKTESFLVYVPDTAWGIVLETLMRVLACLSCMFFVTLTTPFPAVLQVLRRLRIPLIVIELCVIMYRFIFLLLDTAHNMLLAQRCRGGQSGFRGKIRDTAILIVRLFTKTMDRYRKLSYGLISRGFTDSITPPPYEKSIVPLRYRFESIAGTAVLFVIKLWL